MTLIRNKTDFSPLYRIIVLTAKGLVLCRLIKKQIFFWEKIPKREWKILSHIYTDENLLFKFDQVFRHIHTTVFIHVFEK